jgi:hypothetical protein
MAPSVLLYQQQVSSHAAAGRRMRSARFRYECYDRIWSVRTEI